MYYNDEPHGPSTNYAGDYERKVIPLNCHVGRSMAQCLLGLDNDMIEAIVGRYLRGKRVGQLRGAISWLRCNHGGWVRGKGLQRRGFAGEVAIADSFTHQTIYKP
jgi:hypothetical protein